MSRIEWLILFLLFVAYILIGGLVFQKIEEQAEATRKEEAARELQSIQELVSRELRDGSESREEVLAKLSEFCGKPLVATVQLNESSSDPEEEIQRLQHWDFYNSFFVAITVVSTIGYGNLSPTTVGSRMFCIAYALIGIPLNGILLAGLGEYFSRTFLRAHHRYREAPEVESRFALLLKVVQYLAAGICIFILLPAVIFAVAENWTYEEAVYYAFITLSTIGFGDYVAGYMTNYDNWKHSPSLLATYRTFIVLWIVFGLGYLAMILSFITRAMRSSRIRRLEQRVAKRFKSTHARLWHGASRDLRYMRRVLNELYMLKFKVRLQQHGFGSVYPRRSTATSSFSVHPLSAAASRNASLRRPPLVRFSSSYHSDNKHSSLLVPANVDTNSSQMLSPDFDNDFVLIDEDLWYLQPVYRARPSLAPPPMKGRSLSLPTLLPGVISDVPGAIRRSMSESCLDMIDRGATFAAAPRRVDTTELLATVVDALVASAAASEVDMMEEAEELGYHGFTDGEILASEEAPPQRSRTSSIRSLANSLRSRTRSRTGSMASHAGDGELNHRVPRSRGSAGSPVSLRRALAMRNATAAAAAGEPAGYESGSSSPGLKRFERRAPIRDPWARRRSDGAVITQHARMRAASLAPQPPPQQPPLQQLDASTLGDLLRALHSLHSRVEPAPLRSDSIQSDLAEVGAKSALSRHDSGASRPPQQQQQQQRLAQRLLSRLDSHGDLESGATIPEEEAESREPTPPNELPIRDVLYYAQEKGPRDEESDSEKSIIISRL